MRISSFRIYGALNSGPIFDAVESSLQELGHTVVYNELDADMYIIWSLLWSGKMTSNKAMYQLAKYNGIKLMILEVGMLRRNITWKVGIDEFKLPDTYVPRSSTLGVSLKPWKKSGDYVLICGQNQSSQLWHDRPLMSIWVTNTIEEIKKYTDRPIVFRPHPRDRTVYSNLPIITPKHLDGTYDSFDFDAALNNAWAVINPLATPGPLAIINGIPAIVEPNSMAYPMSTSIENIENPNYADRTEWFERICNTEWTLPELNNPNIIDRILNS